MALTERYNGVLICQFMDLEKFFDKEVLRDVLTEAKKNKITDKEYRLLYELNKSRRISVETPVGESKMEEIGEGLGQGGLESAILSSNSIANGLETFFKDSTNKIEDRNIHLQSWGYQDDICG